MDSQEKSWHGLHGATLSLVAGLDHPSLGEKSGSAFLAFSLTLIILIFSSTIWPPAEGLVLSFAIFAAADAFSIGGRGHRLVAHTTPCS